MSRVVPIQSDIAPGIPFFANNSNVVSPGVGSAQAADPNLVVSTVTASQYVSSPQAFISSLNGVAWPPPPASENLVVSTLTAANFFSTPSLLVTNVNGYIYPITGGSVFVSSLTSADYVVANRLTGVSSINGVAYPPPSLGPNFVVSSLVSANDITAPNINLSSINGSVYPPINPSFENLIVSTLTAATSITAGTIQTDQILNLSSVNVTSVSASNLNVSTINGLPTYIFTNSSTYFSTVTLTGVSSTTVSLPSVWYGAPILSVFAGYWNSVGPFSTIANAGFDATSPFVSTLSIAGDINTTVNYAVIGEIYFN
jgi:hypothetical protein